MRAEDFKGQQIILPIAWHRTPAFGQGEPGIVEGSEEVAPHDTIEPMYVIPPGYCIVPFENMDEQVIQESQHRAQVREQRRYEVARDCMCHFLNNYFLNVDEYNPNADKELALKISEVSIVFADTLLETLEKQKGSEEPLTESSNDQAG